jgi:hypothetical protein
MDMNFPHRTKGLAPRRVSMLGDMEPDLHVLLAMASAQQAASPTARFVAADMGAPAEADFVDALSRVFAARRVDKVKAKSLAGCFNPLIAGHLGSGTVPDGSGN